MDISRIFFVLSGFVIALNYKYRISNTKDLIYSTKAQTFKVACGFVLCGLSYRFLPIPNINQHIGVMFLMFFLPPAANIVALETHYQGTGRSAAYIASGTIVSCVCIAIYAVFLHLFV